MENGEIKYRAIIDIGAKGAALGITLRKEVLELMNLSMNDGLQLTIYEKDGKKHMVLKAEEKQKEKQVE